MPLDNKSGAQLDPDDVTVSALPFRAYSLIWNEWFRDQNLQDSQIVNTDDGPDALKTAPVTGEVQRDPLKRGKRHDYFTSCLPWPQKGDAVSLPLGTTATVVARDLGATNLDLAIYDESVGAYRDLDVDAGGAIELNATTSVGHALYADLTNATAEDRDWETTDSS